VNPEKSLPIPEPIERFDRLVDSLISPGEEEAPYYIREKPGIYIFIPRDENTPYSPSIYYKPDNIYIRRSFLDETNPYFKKERYEEALKKLDKLEELTLKLKGWRVKKFLNAVSKIFNREVSG
jgi:hypothetical protein